MIGNKGNTTESKDMEELRLYLPKKTCDRFHKIAKKSKLTIPELFEEMIEAHGYSMKVN